MSNLENYEGTALDTSILELEVQPEGDTEIQTEAGETVEANNDATPATEVIEESNEPTVYHVYGVGDFTADEIRELKNSGLRQSDYTRKTQEIARQREELKNAEELYNHLKNNPHLVNALRNAENNPNGYMTSRVPSYDNEMLKDLIYKQRAMETDMRLNALREKYHDFDEVALLQKATELKTDDLEFVYKALNYDEGSAVERAKAELKAELEANRENVSTTISTRKSSPVGVETSNLTAQEKRVAAAMGMTESEYAKWK